MPFLEHIYSDYDLYYMDEALSDWFFVFALSLFLLEAFVLFFRKQFTWNTVGDSISNFITLTAHIGLVALAVSLYLGVFYFIYPNYSFFMLPNNLYTIVLAVIFADFLYYWEHRFSHRVGLAWLSHTVHHSSPYFNISVAYRHGPLDAVIGLPFFIPMLFLGFDPALVLFSASLVQTYQTLLHTELVKKCPAWMETVLNTPSHHRVHHGSNRQYLDKNYAGILIVWDKLFGTFEAEKEPVVYGVLPPVASVNPLIIFFHGVGRLFGKMRSMKGFMNKLACLYKPPGWGG